MKSVFYVALLSLVIATGSAMAIGIQVVAADGTNTSGHDHVDGKGDEHRTGESVTNIGGSDGYHRDCHLHDFDPLKCHINDR